MIVIRMFLLLLLNAVVHSNPIDKHLSVGEVQYRLPTNVTPIDYSINLVFPEEAFSTDGNTFEGKAIINFKVVEAVTEIKFHVSSDFINITKLLVTNYDLQDTRDYTIDPTTDVLTILSPEAMDIKEGHTYKMVITYTGKISTTDTYGIYKTSYNSNGETKYVIATQFEPFYARRAFPCFDEPSFKATFDFSITYPSNLGYGVLFNTEKVSEQKDRATFQITPKMSSYLVAFVISSYTFTSGGNAERAKVPYVVWSNPDTESLRTYATQIGKQIIRKLNAYTGFTFSSAMSKVDQVALPDFTSEAMENWGLITHRESLLLLDEEESSVKAKQNIGKIIAHELSHQWFGNLITCNWWSETFLNEGFATYFEYFILKEDEATWELEKQFVVNELQPVLEVDALQYSAALVSQVSSQQEISSKFDEISYSKGGSIIRMVSHIMGEENFKNGIQDYIKSGDLQYATATPSRLWSILGKFVDTTYSAFPKDASLEQVMKTWVEQAGYPLLTVSLVDDKLVISQKRFLLSGENTDTLWYVPIIYSVSSQEKATFTTQPNEWLTSDQSEITIPINKDFNWVLLNNQAGYYRVNYDQDLWDRISTALQKENFDGIPDLSRAQIVDDLFSLARAGVITYERLFKLIEFLKNDSSYYTWMPAFKGFNFIIEKFPDGNTLRNKLQEHVLSLSKVLYKSASLDEETDDHISNLKKILVNEWACALGENTCVEDVKRIFKEYIVNNTKPNKNIRSVIYCNILRYSDDADDYAFLWNIYVNSKLVHEKETLLTAMGCSSSKIILQEYLKELIKDNPDIKIGHQDLLTVFSAVYSGSWKGIDVALDFYESNYDKIVEKYPPLTYQSQIMKGIAERLTTKAQFEKLKKIISSHSEYSNKLKETAEEILELANSNLIWIEEHENELEKYFGISSGAPLFRINSFSVFLCTFISLLSYFKV